MEDKIAETKISNRRVCFNWTFLTEERITAVIITAVITGSRTCIGRNEKTRNVEKSIGSHRRRGITRASDAKRSLRGSMTLPWHLTPMTTPIMRMLRPEQRSATRTSFELLRILMDARATLMRTKSLPGKGLNSPSFIIVIDIHTSRTCLRFRIKMVSLKFTLDESRIPDAF